MCMAPMLARAFRKYACVNLGTSCTSRRMHTTRSTLYDLSAGARSERSRGQGSGTGPYSSTLYGYESLLSLTSSQNMHTLVVLVIATRVVLLQQQQEFVSQQSTQSYVGNGAAHLLCRRYVIIHTLQYIMMSYAYSRVCILLLEVVVLTVLLLALC